MVWSSLEGVALEDYSNLRNKIFFDLLCIYTNLYEQMQKEYLENHSNSSFCEGTAWYGSSTSVSSA